MGAAGANTSTLTIQVVPQSHQTMILLWKGENRGGKGGEGMSLTPVFITATGISFFTQLRTLRFSEIPV